MPAHINRGSNGVLNALGFLPENVHYDALEISKKVTMPPVRLDGYRLLESSDAHYLENILEPQLTLQAQERSIPAVFAAIAGHT